MTVKALDIINAAAKDAGILGLGETLNGEDYTDALLKLNWMIAQWRRKRWLIWHLIDVACVSTGAQSYTVGPLGDFNTTARPDRLESAFFRQLTQSQPSQIDYPLEILQSREDYNNIALKQLESFPAYIFYDSTYEVTANGPVGRVYPWPLPQSAIYEIHISLKAIMEQFTTVQSTLALADEYAAAMEFNLARRLRMAYQMPADPELNGMATDALNLIRSSNYQVGRLTMPTDLVRPGIYNPYSDQIR